MIRVKIHLPGGTEQVLEFNKNSVMLGRAAANDVCIDQGGVSRYHATITVDGSSLVVQDLGSTNGTVVAGKKIQSAPINSGDRIVLGDIALEVEFVSDEAQAGELTGLDRQPVPGVTDTMAPGASYSETPPPERAVSASAVSVEGGHGFAAPGENAGRPATAKSPTEYAISRPTMEEVAAAAAPASKAEDASPVESPVAESEPVQAEPVKAEPEKAAAAPEPAHHEPEKPSREQSNNAFFWQALQSFLAPVWMYVSDDAVSEIMINGPSEIYIETKGKLQRVKEHFTPEQLQAAVLNIAQFVGRRVSEEEPYLDARLPDGSRVAVLMPPCSRKGTSLAIRKFSKEKLTLDRLIGFGSLSPQMVTYLNAAVMLKKNIIISGGTSSGKTSLLNVVSGLIPDDERIITIEDSAELQLRQEHVLPMETKPADKKGRGLVTIRDLVKASLRMRPDRIVVGEIRGGEALDLLQAMNTGHSGSMATVHASSPQQALTRLETLSLFSGIEIPLRALREQVSTAIEVVIQASRLPDHSRKVTHISEVAKLTDSGDYAVTDLFRYAREGTDNGKIIGKHVWTGNKSSMLGEMELCGLTDALKIFSGQPPAAGVQYQQAGH